MIRILAVEETKDLMRHYLGGGELLLQGLRTKGIPFQRVFRRPNKAGSYHVFRYLVDGSDLLIRR